ncbi:phosphatidylinositol glycan, class F [Paragonimus westermani]|uniref:Phosphatidylinositol glycan, class F n=1 Tax=Paragonimus westermani TaxID=34504 RepID=A0A5J4N8Z7_9TREM|nr:phosphatidylinositol glycan, class F [Paragonimus westermani]
MFSRDLETNVLKPLLKLVCSVVIYATIFILFGAPFLEQHMETFSLAIVLTCLTTLPFMIFDDVSIKRINAVYFSPRQPHEWFLAFIGYGSLLGTWSSACLLILDWDRPWQAWPYPCVMGALVGAGIGLLLFLIRPYFSHFWHQTHSVSCKLPVYPLPSDVKVCVE